MSPTLRKYLTDWYQWATGDAVDREPFWRAYGLCACAPWGVRAELAALLRDEFGTATYPFGADDYFARKSARTQHECPTRLAWVASKIGEKHDARI